MVDFIGQPVLRASRTLRGGVWWVDIKVIRSAGGTTVPRIRFRGILVIAEIGGMVTRRARMETRQSTVQCGRGDVGVGQGIHRSQIFGGKVSAESSERGSRPADSSRRPIAADV
jgi:hypothetical protein